MKPIMDAMEYQAQMILSSRKPDINERIPTMEAMNRKTVLTSNSSCSRFHFTTMLSITNPNTMTNTLFSLSIFWVGIFTIPFTCLKDSVDKCASG